MALTDRQKEVLLAPIKPHRVFTAQGMAHVAAFDVVAHLTRIFGWGGWDKEILSLDLVHERIDETVRDTKQGPRKEVRCWVTYRCVMRLTVRDPEGNVVMRTEDAATGSAQNMPSVGDAHDFAVKNSVSYALKRCAKDLGDQFGLSLYNKGQTSALVGATVLDHDDDPQDHAPEPKTLGNDEREEPVEDAEVVPPAVDTATGEIIGEVVDEPAPVEEHDAEAQRLADYTLLMTAAKGLDADTKASFAAYGKSQSWPKVRKNMTQEQLADALRWIEEHG